MKTKNLIVLVVVALVLVGLAYLSSSRKGRLTEASTMIGKYVLPGLQETEALNRIEKAVFVSALATVTVARVDNVWVAPNKHDYPVEFGKLRDFLRKLADLKIGQTVPSGESQLRKLELVSPGSGETEGAGTVVKLLDKSDTVIATLMVGKEHEKKPASGSPSPSPSPFGGYGGYGGYPDGRYVAVDGKAYLVTDTLNDIPDDDKDWLDDDLANVSSSDIIEVTVKNAEGKSVTLTRPDGFGDLVLAELAEDEEMDSSKASGLGNALSYLSFEDVVDPGLADKDLGFDKPTVYSAKTKKGKTYTLTLGGSPESSEDRYARLSAVYEPPPEEAADAAKSEDDRAEEAGGEEARKKAEEEAKKKKDEQEKLAKEVRELNEKVGAWTYLIRSHKIDDVTANRDDLVKKKEKEEEKSGDGLEEESKAEDEQKEEESAGEVEPKPAEEAPAVEEKAATDAKQAVTSKKDTPKADDKAVVPQDTKNSHPQNPIESE